MRLIVGLFVVLLSPLASGDDNLLIRSTASVAGRLVMSGTECRKIFYLPKSFLAAPELTKVRYTYRSREVGAKVEVTPLISVDLFMDANWAPPSTEDTAEILAWHATTFSECALTNPQLEPYPSLLISVLPAEAQVSQGFKTVESKFDGSGHVHIKFEIEPLLFSMAETLTMIRASAPRLEVLAFHETVDASARLHMSYELVAEFAQHHYTERVCTETERCFSLFGVKIDCSRRTECSNIPKITQNLQNLSAAKRVELSTYLAPGQPEFKLQSAIDELVSRFLVSHFQATSVSKQDDVTTITLGTLQKKAADAYSDEVVVERGVQDRYLQGIEIGALSTSVAEPVAKIYNSDELRCLAAVNGPIYQNNPCFKK